ERMWKAKFSHPGVVRQEVEELRVLDVPLFTSRPGTDALDLHGAAPVPAFFQGSALAAIRRRLGDLTHSTDAGERDAVRGALAVVAPEHPVPLRAPVSPVEPSYGSTEAFLDAATRIGSDVLELAFDAGDGPAWAGLHYHAQHDAWHVGLLPDDTLSGACGLAMLFGDLHRLGASDRFSGAARVLRERFITRLEGFRQAPPPVPGAPFCGGLVGWGAWLHALSHGAQTPDGERMLDRGLDAFARLPLEQANGAPTDFACGRAGLLAALVAARVAADGPLAGFVADQVDRLTAALTASWEPGQGAYPAGARTLALVPSGRDGVALALARAAAAGLAPLDAVRAWIASAPPAETSGAHIARLAIVRLHPALADVSAVVDAARIFADSVDAQAATPDWLEGAEVALALHATTGDAADLARAREIGGWMLDRRAAHGAWFPDRLAPDSINLSAIRGVAALAHLFTRLHAPDQVGSIRVME
ncbi:MAG TPA: hypothetical protein VFH27_15255, partial [Longimicrobiaceae bacterium]|nr:hypothetical protein [Longimicrobiaceae bacterium]